MRNHTRLTPSFRNVSYHSGWLWCILLAAVPSCTTRAVAGPVEDLTAAYQRASTFYANGEYRAAARAFERAVDLAPNVYGPTNANTAKLLELLANCYSELFRLPEAEAGYRRALAAFEQAEGRDGPGVLRCKSNLGIVYRRMNQWDRAEKMYLDVLRMATSPQQRAVTANNLGYLYVEMDKHPEAGRQFREALAVWEQRRDREARINLALSLHGLGRIAHKQSQMPEAEELFRRALQERDRWLPPGHHWIAHSKGMLAAVYAALGRDREAQPLFEETERAMRAFWGDEHVEVAMEEHELGLLFARLGDVGRAMIKFDSSRKTYRDYVIRTLPGLPRAEQLKFLAEERHRFMDAVAVAFRNRVTPLSVRHSLAWVLNEKGLVQETLAERELLARDAASNPRLSGTVASLTDVRQKLAALSLGGTSKEQQQLRTELIEQEEELVRTLGLQNVRTVQGFGWVSPTAVQRALPEDAVLVEIVRLDSTEPPISAFETRQQTEEHARYIAWTVAAADGELRMWDLGAASEIDQHVSDVRKMIENAPEDLGYDRAEASKRAEDALRPLSKQLLWPLLPELRKSSRWIISPDGPLWLVPWSSLLLPDGRFAIEQATISHTISGRQLASAGHAVQLHEYGVVMADPNFDLAPEEVARNVDRYTSELDRQYSRRSAGRALTSVPKDWRRLPGTRAEVEAITPYLQQFVSGKVYVYRGSRALETFFKRIVRPQVVVLATHGFFLHSTGHQQENPLLRCGIVLAGANRRSDAAVEPDDGVLTGVEVLHSDLRDTKLVVLSACDTGVGQLTSGEGVSGLRQAFHLAGARAIVATLWKIPDQATAQLMEHFWRAMNEQPEAAIALRTAQLAMIRELRDDDAAAHPFLWAAPVLTE